MRASDKTKPTQTVRGPILALDLGQKRVGVALSDDLLISIRRLDALNRSSWKQLLKDVADLALRFDAQSLVIGLPLRMDGGMGSAASEIEQIARNFSRSLSLPVYLQDERLTSLDADERLRAEGFKSTEIPGLIDSESAAIILRDFIAHTAARSPLNSE